MFVDCRPTSRLRGAKAIDAAAATDTWETSPSWSYQRTTSSGVTIVKP